MIERKREREKERKREREKERKREMCVCVYVCVRGRERVIFNSALVRCLLINQPLHLLHTFDIDIDRERLD